MVSQRMGQVVTFYSYNGGVGRTMALANVAVLFAKLGYKTLIADWDLESPGLEFYFRDFLDVEAISRKRGLIDVLDDGRKNESSGTSEAVSWEDAIIEIEIPDAIEPVHLMTAGRRNDRSAYFDKISGFDWADFYQQKGGFLIERLRTAWKEAYDYVLIDSRAGATDTSGVCTIQLSDMLVLLFASTDQSLSGAIDVAKKARSARQDLPFDRASLTCIPVPSKFNTEENIRTSQEWLDRFLRNLGSFYDNWLPRSIDRRYFLESTAIPYSSYYSFGEKLPVSEKGVEASPQLCHAYENLASIIRNDLSFVGHLVARRLTPIELI